MSSFKNMSNSELIVQLKKSKSDGITLKKKLSRREKTISKLIMKTGETSGAKAEDWLTDILTKNINVKSDEELANLDFPKHFLATQLKMSQLKSKKCRRWHPLVIHWCLFMYHQAPKLYKSLENSGILHLPSYQTLLRHTPDVGRKPNFQPGMFIQLAHDLKLNTLEENQKYFYLLLDEMKIKEDLIYSKRTGDLIGYTKIKDPYDKIAAINPELFDKKEKPIATHALVLMVRGATTRLKAPIAHFPTDTISGDELHFIVWRAITLLELKGFKIIAVIGDGASTNRKVFTKHHGHEDGCYRCKNEHASDEDRFIYFVFDPPHLIKTIRNCLLNSGDGCKFRLMFKNGQYMVWNTIIDLFERERSRSTLKKAFRLTDDHVYPQAQQKMKVKLATQVLSESVANAICEEFGEEKSETIKFLRTFNRWFDCMNTRNFQEGYHTRNPWVNPYKTLNDKRLKWLRNDFLQYLSDWENDVQNRRKINGKPYTPEERKKMLLSQETLSGLKQTTMAIVEMIEFLLSKGAMFVLTANVNQDPLENEFSRQRQANGSGQHPTYQQVCDNNPKLRAIKRGKMKLTIKGKNCTNNNNS